MPVLRPPLSSALLAGTMILSVNAFAKSAPPQGRPVSVPLVDCDAFVRDGDGSWTSTVRSYVTSRNAPSEDRPRDSNRQRRGRITRLRPRGLTGSSLPSVLSCRPPHGSATGGGEAERRLSLHCASVRLPCPHDEPTYEAVPAPHGGVLRRARRPVPGSRVLNAAGPLPPPEGQLGDARGAGWGFFGRRRRARRRPRTEGSPPIPQRVVPASLGASTEARAPTHEPAQVMTDGSVRPVCPAMSASERDRAIRSFRASPVSRSSLSASKRSM